jgi:hypothetical protein
MSSFTPGTLPAPEGHFADHTRTFRRDQVNSQDGTRARQDAVARRVAQDSGVGIDGPSGLLQQQQQMMMMMMMMMMKAVLERAVQVEMADRLGRNP